MNAARPTPADDQGAGAIFDCQQGPVGSDQNAAPYDAIIDDATVKRGDVRDVEDGPCRDYDIALPTPHDPAEDEFQFSMCINERDHLPREIRRTPPGSNQEQVSTYTQWNALAEPPLPAGFPR